MKKQEKTGIKTIYSDALYWSMSPMSKDKKYHLSRVHESVLRKLIHYDHSNIKITYSNQWISKHTFLHVSQIEKSIPYLEKIGFINCITFSTRNKNAELIKRRIININLVLSIQTQKRSEHHNKKLNQKHYRDLMIFNTLNVFVWIGMSCHFTLSF
jgi:hypothetical protein